MTATVHVIDDDAALRQALARLLGAAGYQVRTYAAAGDYLVPEPADELGCLLLDLQMDGVNGLELQAALARHPGYERPIIFLSGAADITSSVAAMRAGAHDFLTKPVRSEVLLATVAEALRRDMARRDACQRREQARTRIAALAPRERQVLAGITSGRLHKQIAGDLGICERTVKLDRARLMKRLGVRNLSGLIALLMQAEAAESAEPAPAPDGQGLASRYV